MQQKDWTKSRRQLEMHKEGKMKNVSTDSFELNLNFERKNFKGFNRSQRTMIQNISTKAIPLNWLMLKGFDIPVNLSVV